MKHTLTCHAVMWTHSGTIDRETNPVMPYKVTDEHGREVAFITNTRASGRPASWRISRLKDGVSTGESAGNYDTAEDALHLLQEEFST